MRFWDWVFAPFLEGTPGDPDGSAALAFLCETEDVFAAAGVGKTPFAALRVVEVLSTALVSRALEGAMYAEGVVQGTSRAGTTESGLTVHPLLEAYAKLLDRRRKALAEIEGLSCSAGAPAEIGLADEMKPILKQAEGVLEEVLAYKPRKRKRSA